MTPNHPTSSQSSRRDERGATKLRRVRNGVRCALVLGVVASVAANILHARDELVSQFIAAWPPLALLLTVELISRVPVHRRSLAVVRLAATTTIAGIAGWVSYWHMAAVAARYGETGASPYLIPLSVDGLVVVASICLVELAERIQATDATDATDATPRTVQAAVGVLRHASGDEAPDRDEPVDELVDEPVDERRDELDARRRRRDEQKRDEPKRRATGGGRRAIVSTDAIVAAIAPYVVECRRDDVEPVGREMIRLVRAATGRSVGAPRCVEAAELVADVEAATSRPAVAAVAPASRDNDLIGASQ